MPIMELPVTSNNLPLDDAQIDSILEELEQHSESVDKLLLALRQEFADLLDKLAGKKVEGFQATSRLVAAINKARKALNVHFNYEDQKSGNDERVMLLAIKRGQESAAMQARTMGPKKRTILHANMRIPPLSVVPNP